jgi:peptide/nickel transport system substrate-binding protein
MSKVQRFDPEGAIPPRPFGALLRHHRILADLTQGALAGRAGLSERSISDLERGVSRTPQSGTVELLAEALQLEASEREVFAAAARREKLQEPSDPTPLSLVSGTTREDGQENARPRRFGALPARRQRTTLVLGLFALVVVVAASMGLGSWLRLGLFGKGGATTPPPPSYVYAQPTHKGGTITFSYTGFPDSTNPWFLSNVGDNELAEALWGNPYTISPTGKLLPDELTEIPAQANGDISKDGLVITMHLRPDLKWSDGQPLTADDFAYSLEVLQDPDSEADSDGLSGYDRIAAWQVLDARTLVLHYKQPDAFAFLYLPWAAPRHVWGSIAHKELSSRDDVNLYPKVTSGPFVVDSDVPGQSITMVPNQNYRSSTLHASVLDKLIFTAYPTTDALMTTFVAGQTEFTDAFGPDDLLKYGGVEGLHVSPFLGYTLLDFNLSQPALQDDQVRKAIEEAIDRCGMILAVYHQPCASLRVDAILPAPSPDYDPTIKTYGYNLAQARRDMQIAGWDCPGGGICTRGGQPFPTLKLVTSNGFVTRYQAMELLQHYLAALGIPASLNYYSSCELFCSFTQGGILATGHYDLALFANAFDLDDDRTFSSFESSQIPSASNPFGSNWERVNDPLVDAELDQGRITLDTTARTHIYQALEQVLVQKVYVIPLYLFPNLALVNSSIGNYQANPFQAPGNLWNVGDWFLMTETSRG